MGREFIYLKGDIATAQCEAIVNAWNRNFIPYWLLVPQGVSRALRRKAGKVPFRQVSRMGLLKVGQAVASDAGNLPARMIIHVAALHASWRSSDHAVRLSMRNLLALAAEHQVESVALPLLGAGTGGLDPATSAQILEEEWRRFDDKPAVTYLYIYDANLYSPLVAQSDWEDACAHFLCGQFWEAHESLETIWRRLPPSDAREYIQSLIQFAAACHKPVQAALGRQEHKMQRGMRALIDSGRGHLTSGTGQPPTVPCVLQAELDVAWNNLEEISALWADGKSIHEVSEALSSLAGTVSQQLKVNDAQTLLHWPDE